MSTVFDIYSAIDFIAPFALSMGFDNTGILVGDRNKKVTKALLALDCTSDIVNEAARLGAQLIITHHPVIFDPMKRVNEDSVVYELIRNNLAVISAHTNLDIAKGGVNDALAEAVGLHDCRGLELLDAASNAWLGRVGELDGKMTAREFALHLKEKLGAAAVKFAGAGKLIKKVALCSGSGADCLNAAKAVGADALLTGEVKQHQYIDAVAMGISIFEAGHFDTEDVVIEPLKEKLSTLLPDVEFLTSHFSRIEAI